jgi:hypothetical protein
VRFAFPLAWSVPIAALACSSEPAPRDNPGALGLAFDSAAAAAGVPRDLMVAIAQVEDGLSIPAQREVEPDAAIPIAGPLQLRRGKLDTLALAARLSGHSELELRQDAELALGASGLALAEVGANFGARAADLTSWEAALEAWGGFADEPHRVQYAHKVFALLARGGTFEGRDGELVALSPHDLPPSLTLTLDTSLRTEGGAEYPGAEWFPTSCTGKCDTTRGGNAIGFVVIHDTEGGWSGSVATLQNDPGKSVQYIVDTNGHVGQFVPESFTAWHAGNYYYNQRSVGIEHVGYYNKPFPEALYASSAKLVDYLATKYKVARDRAHVIGHDQIPDGTVIASSSAPCDKAPSVCEGGKSYGGAANHVDPGDFEWCTYMPRFGGTCKCNDIWSLWNCSSDKVRAFRCQGGTVELESCDGPGGCESMPNGLDDVCHQLPKSPDAGVADGGAADAATEAGAAHDAGSGAPPATPDEGCTCSATPGARAGSGAWAAGAFAALAVLRRRRRQS